MVASGRKVRVYYNLHRKCLSVQDYATRRVIAHTGSILLADVTLSVSAAGRARVLREGHKNVHAYVVGTVIETMPRGTTEVTVTYNPYKYTSFVNRETEAPVTRAVAASIVGRSIHAVVS